MYASPKLRALVFLAKHLGIYGQREILPRYIGSKGGNHLFTWKRKTYRVDLVLEKVKKI